MQYPFFPIGEQTEYVSFIIITVLVLENRVEKLMRIYSSKLYPNGREFVIYMNQAAKAAEEWLYTGPFKFNYYPEIPAGITTALTEFFLKKQSLFKSEFRKSPELGRSFMDALESLLGPKIYDDITLP